MSKSPSIKFSGAPQGRVLAIDFSQDMVQIVDVERRGERMKLLNYAIRKSSPAEEFDEASLVQFIQEFLNKNAIREKNIIVSVSDAESVMTQYLTMPALPEAEIPAAAKWQLKEDAPFDLDHIYLDWQILKEFTEPDGTKKCGILFVVAQSETIDRYLSVINKCRLTPIRIVSNAFNYANLLKLIPEKPDVTAVLDIGYKEGTLNIYTGDQLEFVRGLPISWERLTHALTEILVSDKGKIELTYEEAQELQYTVGIPQDPNQLVRDNIQSTHIISLMRPLLEALVREIRFSFDYFAASTETPKPTLLYLTGDGANLKNLDRYLKQELDVDVAILPLAPGIEQVASKTKEIDQMIREQNLVMGALGAALSRVDAINLIPPEIMGQRVFNLQKIALRLLAFTMAAVFMYLLFIVEFQIRDYQSRIKNGQIHLETIQKISIYEEKIRVKENLKNKIQHGRVPADGVLKIVSMLVPEEIHLVQLNLDQIKHSLTLLGKVTASKELTETILTDFMGALEESSFFTEASLVSSKQEGLVQAFEVTCDLIQE